MNKKLFFIFNPFSGKLQVRAKLYEIIDAFVKGGYDVQVYPTQKPGDATEKARMAAAWADVVVCCGGDGTLDETVNGLKLQDRDVAVGYIPAGSTNDFASSLQISRDMAEAAKQICRGEVHWVDVGAFNDQCFVYVAAFGVFTATSYQTAQPLKNVLGHLAYLLEGVKEIFEIKTYRMRIESEEKVYEGEFIYGMVTNSKSVGGFKNLTGKNVEMDDGFFEVTLIRAPKTPADLAEIVSCLMTQEDTSNLIESFKASRLTINTQEEVTWTLDGEYGGAPEELVIENHRRALPILLEPENHEELPLKSKS